MPAAPSCSGQYQISECVQRREREHEEHHDRPVQRQQGQVEFGRHDIAPDRRLRKDQVETHHPSESTVPSNTATSERKKY